jgi:ribosomal protein L11 methyltransferase
MLRVYELKGSGRLRDLPAEGLEGIWPEPPFYYLFYRKESAEPILEWLKSRPDWLLTARYDLPYDKWQDISVTQISLGSFNIRLSADPAAALIQGAAPPPSSAAAERISTPSLTCPRPEACGPAAGTPILIDPGVVFGSGLHPTTQGCLLAISEIFGSNEIHTALDFGAGTGILAIACALAGAKFVLAVDRNPLALKIARKNARTNGVADRIALVEADRPGCLSIRPDLFIVNLEWPVIEQTLAAGEWRNARRVVLAGFLESRLESVKKFARPEFQVDSVIERQGWPTVVLSAE